MVVKKIVEVLLSILSQMFTYGEVAESFYDYNDFSLNKDHDENVWYLRSEADNLARFKVLYNPTVTAKK